MSASPRNGHEACGPIEANPHTIPDTVDTLVLLGSAVGGLILLKRRFHFVAR